MRELQQALAAATDRFQALDPAGVLAHVSEQYRNGPFTRPSLREHLLAMFTLYDAVRARVRVGEVHLVDGAAWVYSTGEISGRLRGIGVWKARDEETRDRIGATDHHDRDRRGRVLGRPDRGRGYRDDQIHPAPHQIGGEIGQGSKSSLAARISNRRSRPSTYPRSRSRWRSSAIPPRADTEDGVR